MNPLFNLNHKATSGALHLCDAIFYTPSEIAGSPEGTSLVPIGPRIHHGPELAPLTPPTPRFHVQNSILSPLELHDSMS